MNLLIILFLSLFYYYGSSIRLINSDGLSKNPTSIQESLTSTISLESQDLDASVIGVIDLTESNECSKLNKLLGSNIDYTTSGIHI